MLFDFERPLILIQIIIKRLEYKEITKELPSMFVSKLISSKNVINSKVMYLEINDIFLPGLYLCQLIFEALKYSLNFSVYSCLVLGDSTTFYGTRIILHVQ